MACNFRLLSLRSSQGDIRPGLLVGELVYDIGGRYGSVLAILDDWAHARAELSALAQSLPGDANGAGLSDVSLAPPVAYPGALYCAGANYRDHVIEMSGKPPPANNDKPFFFMKTTRGTIVGPCDDICLPEYAHQVDWEAEIGLVIGTRTRNVDARDAMDHVAGFVVLNDLSARDLMKRNDVPFLFDWIGQKCFDTACPMGPWITPVAAIQDPGNLRIRLSVNGEIQQDSNSGEMIFGYSAQVAYLSKHVTLYPGDVIATGTPAGCGLPQGKFLKPGDLVEVEVEGLGALANRVR